MRLPVGDIVELIGPEGAVRLRSGELLGQPARDAHVIVGVGIGRRRDFDQRRAGDPERELLFLALAVGNDDDALQAQRIAHQGQADAGVARRALDNGAAAPDQPATQRIADDEERGAILDRLTRVEKFRLAKNGAARGLGGTPELDQRRIANRGDHAI